VVVDVEFRRYGVEDQIAALARKLNLPLVTTFMGREVEDRSPRSLSRAEPWLRQEPSTGITSFMIYLTSEN
jgi:thiamine pyrophosphate-dependent acetolactate synthase large subunit-like protein